jgi:hypothetical protein
VIDIDVLHPKLRHAFGGDVLLFRKDLGFLSVEEKATRPRAVEYVEKALILEVSVPIGIPSLERLTGVDLLAACFCKHLGSDVLMVEIGPLLGLLHTGMGPVVARKIFFAGRLDVDVLIIPVDWLGQVLGRHSRQFDCRI